MISPPARRFSHGRPSYWPLPSGHSTIVWPALPGPGAARKLALLQQLEQSQWWLPEQLSAQQLLQATGLLKHAHQQVPFYRSRLDQVGFVPDQPLTLEIWHRIPILTRAELQQVGPDLHAAALPPKHGATSEISTSGSTGRPVTTRGSSIVQFMWEVLTLREHLWHRRDFSTKLVAIRSYANGTADYPDGLLSTSWSQATQEIFGTGPAAALHIGSKIEDQVEWLQRQQPGYLLTYPSVLRELLIYCRRKDLRFPSLRQVRTLAELLSPETRQLCREVWGLEIADLYSAQETGYLAFQCSEHGAYHVQAESVVLEILDKAGRTCRPGQVGQVVVTPLHNYAMPLLRYAVGDLAEIGDPCPCGRGLPVLKRIFGRGRDLLVYPDGRKSWALLGASAYNQIREIRQFQVVQHAVDDLELKIVSDRVLKQQEEAKLRRWIHGRCGHEFPIRITYHDEIPRSAGGKFHDFRCNIPDGEAS